ncbi:hypothetical protein Emed_003024 [Eimeria media]
MHVFAVPVLSFCLAAAVVAHGVDVGVYYESRCPSCQDYVDQQIVDLAKHAKDLQMAKVAIHPVPYGNTKETLKETGHYQYECQHGPEECYLNRVEACGLSLMNEMQIDVYVHRSPTSNQPPPLESRKLLHIHPLPFSCCSESSEGSAVACVWAPWLSCVNRSQIDVASLLKAEEHIMKAVAASQQAMKEAERARTAAAAAAEAARHGNLGPAAAEAAAAAMAASNAAHDAAKASAEVTAASAAAATGGRNSWVMCELMVPHGKMLMFEILACSLSPVAIAEKDLKCAICTSPAGKERSLQQLCAGKEGCDKQHQQQQQQQEEQQQHEQQQQQQQKEQQSSEGVVPQDMKPNTEKDAGMTAGSVAAASLGFFHRASLDEV